MAKKELYTIEAGIGTRAESVERGYLEKGMGQMQVSGQTQIFPVKRAEIGFPNFTEAWGARLDKNGKIPDTPLEVTNSNYGGQIELMKWGDKRGYIINCRYLKGYNSIDLLYQQLVLKSDQNYREDTEAAADFNYIRMLSGENDFDVENDRYLIQMLRAHYMNQDSVSKNPDEHATFMFKEVNYKDGVQTDSKSCDQEFDAISIVKMAASDNSLQKLKNLWSIVEPLFDEKPKDSELYVTLFGFAKEDSETFLSYIAENKKNISNVIEKAKSYNILDLTKDGVIVAGQQKKEIIGEGIKGKGYKMLEWLIENYLETLSVETVFKLKQITDNLK